MRWPVLFAGLLLACTTALANEAKTLSRPIKNPAVSTSVAPGQSGYVHYFVLEHPDGSLEGHVGIELQDQRIAWSFPDAGVIVSPFIALGQLKIGDKIFKIQHLYGIRPFNDDRSMQTLRSDLNRRVALWIDDETPYCLFRSPNGPFCLSCGDFVLRVLYPGNQPLTPALPRDFGLAISGAGYTTDDLLLYLVGLHQLPTTDARLKQLARLDIPANLREDIKEMLTVADPLADTPAPAASAPSTVAEKAKAASKPPAKLVQRRQVRKNL